MKRDTCERQFDLDWFTTLGRSDQPCGRSQSSVLGHAGGDVSSTAIWVLAFPYDWSGAAAQGGQAETDLVRHCPLM